jgi:Ca2+-binding EF-hand superfamily protein
MDEDGNGKLSIQEIRKRLGENVSEEKYQKLLKNFDKNKDGYISKAEFV